MTDVLEGQMSIFDRASASGKTCPEHSVREPRKGRTSKPSSKSSSKSSAKKYPVFLSLKRDGQTPDASAEWEMEEFPSALLTESTTPSGGAWLNAENGFLCLPISADSAQGESCLTLNLSEKPREPIVTKLSWILEPNPDPKYQLSPKACQGILNRAAKRGKALPPELKTALEAQAGVLTDGMCSPNTSSLPMELQNPSTQVSADTAAEKAMSSIPTELMDVLM